MIYLIPDEGAPGWIEILTGLRPAEFYLGLYRPTPVGQVPDRTAILADGIGVQEASGSNYARVPLPPEVWERSDGGASAEISFPSPGPGGWGTVAGVVVVDAATGGRALVYAALEDGSMFCEPEMEIIVDLSWFLPRGMVA